MPRKTSINTASKLPFPNEVLSLVFNHLLDTHPGTLARCCRVSRSFFDLASPVLYKRIQVSNIQPRDSRIDCEPDRFTATGKEKSNTRKKKLLKFAEVVTMDSHHATWCGDKTFKYPNLKVLVLNLVVNGLGSVLHSNDVLEKQCSLVRGLQPRKLVLSGIALTNISTFEMFGVPEKLFQNIEELTLISPVIAIIPREIIGGFSDLPKLRKLVWIFKTNDRNGRWVSGFIDHLGLGENPHPKLQGSVEQLAHFLLAVPEVPTFIVNSGPMHHEYVNEASWEEVRIQEKFKAALKKQMIDSGIMVLEDERRYSSTPTAREDHQALQSRAEAMAIKKFDKLQFLTMKQYFEHHDWVGEFTWNQAKLWL